MTDERKTSFAQDIKLDSYTQSVLDRAEALRDNFNTQEADKVQQFQQEQPNLHKGSEQVQNTKPNPEPYPSFGNSVDAEKHINAMTKDDKQARLQSYVDRANTLAENTPQALKDNFNEHAVDRSR